MAEIPSDEIGQLCTLLCNHLPPPVLLYIDFRELLHEIESLPVSERASFLHLARDVLPWIPPAENPFSNILNFGYTRIVYSIFQALRRIGRTSAPLATRDSPHAGLGAFPAPFHAVPHANDDTGLTLQSILEVYRQGEFIVLSNSLPHSVAHIQPHSPRPTASPGNGRVGIIPGHGEYTSAHGRIGNSAGHQRAFSFSSNSTQSYSQRLSASSHGNSPRLYNPPGHVINIPTVEVDGEFPGGHQRILAEYYDAAGHSELFNALFPATLTIAYEARQIFKSIYNVALPLSIKTSGYLAVGFAGASVFLSLAGLSLSTFKPNNLPFGCKLQRMMDIVHKMSVHTTANAFIGTMSHQFLQDDPIIMWTAAGLASAGFMGLMIFIGRRREGQGTFRTAADFPAVQQLSESP